MLTTFKLLMLIFFFLSCGAIKEPDESKLLSSLSPHVGEKKVFVLNSLSQDFSIYSPSTGEVEKHIDFTSQVGEPCFGPNKIRSSADYIFIVCSLSQAIHRFAIENFRYLDSLYLPDNTNPWDIAFYQDYLYVSSFLKNKILIYDSHFKKVTEISLQVLASSNVAARPQKLLIKPPFLYVSLAMLDDQYRGRGSGFVGVIDLETHKIVKSLKASTSNTVDVSFSPNGDLYVISAGDYRLGEGFVGNGAIDIFDGHSFEHQKMISLYAAPFNIKFHVSGRAFLSNAKTGSLIVVDWLQQKFETFKTIQQRCGRMLSSEKMSYISSILITDQTLYLTEFNGHCLVAIDVSTLELLNSWRVGQGPEDLFIYREI